jgi:hypothetical protein
MNKSELSSLVKAWNNYVGENDPRFIPRYGSRKVQVPGSKKPLEVSRSGIVKPDKNNPKSWGLTWDGNLSKAKFENDKDGFEKAQAAYMATARKSGGRGKGKGHLHESIKEHLSSDKNPFGHAIPDVSDEQELDEAFVAIQNEAERRQKEIKDLDAIIKNNPKASSTIRKQIDKILKTEPDKEKRAALRIKLWKKYEQYLPEKRMSFKQWIS